MGRYDRKRKTKKRSEAQIQALESNRKRAHISVKDKENTPISAVKKENEDLKKTIKQYQQKAKEQQKKYWNEYRKNYRLQKASKASKANLKDLKADARWLRGALALAEKKACDIKKAADETTLRLQARIHNLEKASKNLQQSRAILLKRGCRLESALHCIKKRTQAKSRKHPTLFKLTSKGIYTAQARALARMMVWRRWIARSSTRRKVQLPT
ncbi:hypothetical protein BJ912DRAFT_1058025 [Pholiota molesta]|nr:hypothetical protein BJ912DRAFT_1058025 [Pholiota molesta]